MTKPVTIPNTFATATNAIPLSQLDGDFTAVANAINDANTYSNYAADTGSANAYVVTFTGVSTTYSAGLRIQFKAGNANTGASTLNVNAQGNKNITFQDTTTLTSGTIAANAIVDVMYDGTQFLLMNDPAGTIGTGDVVGPASATDNAVVRFDGTTGKLVQNSAVTVADTTGDITGGKYNGLTVTTTTGTLTITNGKTLAASNTLTLAGTDSTTMTFPSTSASIARTDAGQTFTGTQTFSSPIAIGSGGTGLSATPTNGQIDIGNGTGFTRATLTAGSGISITNGAGSISIAATGGGGGLAWQSVQTTGFTAVAGRAYPCNTTSAAFTVTLPASPAAGDLVTLTDYAGTWNTNNLTVNPNGNKVEGSTDNQLVSTNRGSVNLVYIDATQGWITYANVATDIIYPAIVSLDYLVVAGGGGGGTPPTNSVFGGAGGAGGYLEGSATLNLGTAYTVTVGGGGSGTSSSNTNGGAGSNSVLSTITAYGGGFGPSVFNNGGNGGSGGASGYNNSVGKGVYPGSTYIDAPRQGYDGGNNGGIFASGGGGGAGGAGANASGSNAGNGGTGKSSSISGSSVTYAGGGGGGAYVSITPGTGGSSIGGNGAAASTPGTNASPANRGSGGGGGATNGTTLGASGNGSSGVVIIKIPSTNTATFSGGVTQTSTTSGGYKIYTVTATSTISETVTFS